MKWRDVGNRIVCRNRDRCKYKKKEEPHETAIKLGKVEDGRNEKHDVSSLNPDSPGMIPPGRDEGFAGQIVEKSMKNALAR